MKKTERVIWISTVAFLLMLSAFGIFVNTAEAGSLNFTENNFEKLKVVLKYIKSDFVDEAKVDEKDLINGAIKGMLESLKDPYTSYLSEDEMRDMATTSSGTFGGVGMYISEKDGYINVISPIEDTPAFRKGMRPGDLIISVDGESLKGVSVGDAAKKLRGKPGTKVKIEFFRDDIKLEAELMRAIIDVPTVKYDTIKDKYGYLKITQFSGTTTKHVKEALEDFKTKNISGLIVDLRWNPGGLLGSVIDIVDFFQDNGIIVSTRGRKLSEKAVYKASEFSTIVPKDMPLIVIVDKGSASASEIFSGAMKDLHRGILIGEKTYGKGSVQTIYPLGVDGIKLTIAKYYTPSGVSIHEIGIEPDIEVKEPELTEDEKTALKKIYDEKLIEKFTDENKSPTQNEIIAYIEEIHKKGYKLPKRHLKKMIKNSLDSTKVKIPVYDLEYDIQLQKAIELLDKNKIVYENETFLLKENN